MPAQSDQILHQYDGIIIGIPFQRTYDTVGIPIVMASNY
jgi:hypothetical protein